VADVDHPVYGVDVEAVRPAIDRVLLQHASAVRLGRMDQILTILHVVGAVFIVGPMAILPQTALRALRAGNSGQVATLAKSTFVFTLLSVIVFVLGFGVMGMSDPKYNLSFTTPWILWSVIAYAVALVVSLLVVVPAMRRAAGSLEASPATAAGPATTGSAKAGGYGAIAAGSGIVSLLLLVVVVLMVWKP
jgi:uncharacterized membrane protein